MIKSGDLQDRSVIVEPDGSKKVRTAEPRRMISTDELAARIEAARAVPLLPSSLLHCGHCFGEGRDAAIRAFESEAGH